MTSPAPMRIVHLDTGLELRGGQRQLLMLARGLRERGHRQWIVCREGSGLEIRAAGEGLEVFSLPAHDPWHAFGILLLRQRLRHTPFDILHAHDGAGQTVAWAASWGLPARRVASRRVTFLPTDRWTFRAKYHYTCDAVIAVSEFVKGLAVKAGVPPGKIEVIHDAVEIPPGLPSAALRRQIRDRWRFDENDFVIGHVGAFTAEKGQDVALRALLLARESLPQIRLVMVGGGPLRDSREFKSRLAHSQGSAKAFDPMENLDEFFAALDLYVMPSRAEGLGSSALLAMARGLPVVASRVGGLPEIVEENVTGWLVPPDSPEALADALVTAAADRARLRDFGASARQRARQFSAAIMLDRTEALYRRLLSGRHG